MPFDDLRQWIAALDRAGQLKRIQTEVDPILEIAEITDRVSKSRDAKGAAGWPGASFPESQGPSRIASPDQSVRLRRPHEARPRRQFLRRDRRSHPHVYGREVSAGISRQVEDASSADRSRQVFPAHGANRALQRSDQARQFLVARFPDPAVLAQGCRTLYHSALRHHARSASRASAIWACTACRFTTNARRACTGSARKLQPSTRASACGRPWKESRRQSTSWRALRVDLCSPKAIARPGRWRLRSPSAPIRP